jgi:hypothetical protein
MTWTFSLVERFWWESPLYSWAGDGQGMGMWTRFRAGVLYKDQIEPAKLIEK